MRPISRPIVIARFVILFDREGYSPEFFKEMWQTHRIARATAPDNAMLRTYCAYCARPRRVQMCAVWIAQYAAAGVAHGGQTSNIPAGAEEREKGPPTKMLGDAPLVKPAGDPHLASSRVDRALRRCISR